MKKLTLLSTLTAAAALAAPAFADTVTWTGAGSDSNWNTAGNWDNTWTDGDNAAFTNDATNKTVTVDETITAGSVTVSGGSYTFEYGNSGVIDAETFEITSGSSLSINADENTVYIGTAASTTDSTSITVSGSDSKLSIYGSNVRVNYATAGYNTSLTAENGGSIYIETYKENPSLVNPADVYFGTGSSGDVYVTATGEGSIIDVESCFYIVTNVAYVTDGVNTYFTATNGGTIKLFAQAIQFNQGSVLVADNGGTIQLLNQDATDAYNIFLQYNSTITITNNSKLITGEMSMHNTASVTIDGTSTWEGSWTELRNSSSISITTSANAVSTLDGDSGANVSFTELYISTSASITVVIDISALDDYTSASIAIFNADSVTFDVTNWGTTDSYTGTELTNENVNDFAAGHITVEENGFTIDSWSYTDGTLYANITTTPEPSMFGLMFGLAAIALVATRRRRRA